MRITGGAARSIVLKTVDVEILRPDTDAMRVALFNSLGDVSGVIFYDLFAGCGATGLESLSRGASKVVFIERHPKLSKIIAENLAAVAKSAGRKVEECEVHRGDVLAYPYPRGVADVVFCDPPYSMIADNWPKFVEIASTVLKSGGLFLMEHPAESALPLPEGFEKIKTLGGKGARAPNIEILRKL